MFIITAELQPALTALIVTMITIKTDSAGLQPRGLRSNDRYVYGLDGYKYHGINYDGRLHSQQLASGLLKKWHSLMKYKIQ